LFFIIERKLESGPSYFTPINTVSSTTIIALNDILTIGLFEFELILFSSFKYGLEKNRFELSEIGTTETAH
jgi:hypothetical protein